jgi:outer membrane protein assembly factor BamE (lipoprotein component of BamABCDE complex)
MRSPARCLIVALLSACAVASGCRSPESAARERRTSVELGMTKDQVRERIGSPSTVHAMPAGGMEGWHYAFQSGVGAAEVVFFVIVVAVLIVLVAAAAGGKGGGGSWGGLGGLGGGGRGGSDATWHFWVTFDASGRVVALSPVERR